MKKGLYSLEIRDVLKGFITAMLTSIMTASIAILNAGNIPTDFASWKPTIIAGIASGLGYILKNFLTNKDDQFMKKDKATSENPA